MPAGIACVLVVCVCAGWHCVCTGGVCAGWHHVCTGGVCVLAGITCVLGVRGATIHKKFGASRFSSTIRFHDTLADILIRIAIYFCFVRTNSALDWSLRLRNVHNAITRTL